MKPAPLNWDKDAEAAIKKVPFFVRKKVRKKVEDYVLGKGEQKVTLSHVTALKKKFLSKGGMENQIQGHDVSACFGGEGCPNSVVSSKALLSDIQDLMEKADIRSFLKTNVQGDLKFHHEFRVSLSDCPNACSRPQIVDIGIIGASRPRITEEPCSLCNACVDICPDLAITLDDTGPVIDETACLSCGKCMKLCPTTTLEQGTTGFRVLLGGRLGRHPRLGMEVPAIHSHDQVLHIVEKSLDFYKTNSKNGNRFSKILTSTDQIMDKIL